MSRPRNPISTLRSILYGLARLLGDFNAILKGPGAVGKRLMRRGAGKLTGRTLGKIFR